MKIKIQVFADEDMERLYDSAIAETFLNAETRLAMIGNHWEHDLLTGKLELCAECNNAITRDVMILPDDSDAEVERGHQADCPKITALV